MSMLLSVASVTVSDTDRLLTVPCSALICVVPGSLAEAVPSRPSRLEMVAYCGDVEFQCTLLVMFSIVPSVKEPYAM